MFRNDYVVENLIIFSFPFLLMAVFSKTVSKGPLEPVLALIPLSPALKTLFSYDNLIHALAGAVVSFYIFFVISSSRSYIRCQTS